MTLYVRDANGVVPLDPPFESAHEDYSVSVRNATTIVTVYATPSQDDASVEYLDSNDMSLAYGRQRGRQQPRRRGDRGQGKGDSPGRHDGNGLHRHNQSLRREPTIRLPASLRFRARSEWTRPFAASKGTIADADGLTNASYSYQWIRAVNANSETNIANATNSTYDLTSADEGNRIKVKASFSDVQEQPRDAHQRPDGDGASGDCQSSPATSSAAACPGW